VFHVREVRRRRIVSLELGVEDRDESPDEQPDEQPGKSPGGGVA